MRVALIIKLAVIVLCSSFLHHHPAQFSLAYSDTSTLRFCGYVRSGAISFQPATYENGDSIVLAKIEELFEGAGLYWNQSQSFVKLLQDKNAKNCYAVIDFYQRDQPFLGCVRFIVYDPLFMDSVTKVTGSTYSVACILAHELAHHLHGHMLNSEQNARLSELQADYFSGFMLARIADDSITLDESLRCLQLFGDLSDTDTHPNKTRRIESFTEGWNYAKLMDSVSCEAQNKYLKEPEKMVNILENSAPAYFQRLKSTFLTASVKRHIRAVSRKLKTSKQHMLLIKGDENIYLADNKNNVEVLGPDLQVLDTFSVKVTTAKEMKFNSNKSVTNQEEGYQNQLLVDEKYKLVWDRLPNGLPYVIGAKVKIDQQ